MKKNILFTFTIFILSVCVSPPEYSDGLLENIPAIVNEPDYFSLSIFGDQFSEDNEWELSLDVTEFDVMLQTLAVKDLNSSSDSTYLYVRGADGDTLLYAWIMSDMNWSSEDSVSYFGYPDNVIFSGKNFSGRIEYQLLKK